MHKRLLTDRRALLAALLAAALLLSCGGERQPLNVIVVGIDTLRPDHLGCYGYHRPTSPNIDEFAAGGVLFENVISQAPWTAPSFATVFSSLYPSQHGSMDVNSKIRESVPTLATMLKEKGYATGAIINAPALKPEFGLSRGFDFYDMTPLGGRIGDGTTRDALAWIDENRGGPFFMFVHYFDPHLPYAPPAGYDDLFNKGYRGRIENPFDLEGFSKARGRLFEEMKDLTQDDWAEILDLYDGEIVFADEAFGDLIRGLEDRGLTEDTVIILLSDHGEEFFEHGGFEHGHSVYDELIRVPLVIWLPGVAREGTRVRNQVRLLDVTPTVFDLLGLDTPAHFEGVSLVPYLAGGTSVEARAGSLLPPHIAYAEAIRLGAEKKAVTARPHKVIYDLISTEREFYDLDSDPGETVNMMRGVGGGSFALLENTLFRTILGIDETWYIEMAAGESPREFDIEVVSRRGPSIGRIYIPRLVEPDGNLVEFAQPAKASATEQNTLSLTGFKVEKRMLLAFKATPAEIPLEFDLKIDGQPALASTYLGASLESPTEMPFRQRPKRDNIKARGKPARRPPESPYIAVWVSENVFRGETALDLSEETRRELRSLGYIQ
jgi:arylsulfatase A-like enzyme